MSEGSNVSKGSSFGHGSSHGAANPSTFNSNSGGNRGFGANWGSNRSRGTSENISHGYSESMEYAIEPGFFASGLKTGGPENLHKVTAVFFQAGRTFSNGSNYLLTEFQQ